MEGPRAEKSDKKTPISTQPNLAAVADDADSRSDPTFTCASPGLAVAGPNSLKLVLLVVKAVKVVIPLITFQYPPYICITINMSITV